MALSKPWAKGDTACQHGEANETPSTLFFQLFPTKHGEVDLDLCVFHNFICGLPASNPTVLVTA
jgi:hypothetical protein